MDTGADTQSVYHAQVHHAMILLLVIPEPATVSHHQKRRLYQPFSTWFLERVKPHCPRPSTVCNDLPSTRLSWVPTFLWAPDCPLLPGGHDGVPALPLGHQVQ